MSVTRQPYLLQKTMGKAFYNGFQWTLSSKTGECKISCCWCLKIDFLQTTFKGNVPECARVTRFSCLVSTISTIVFCLNSLRPQWLQWALAKISGCHVTGKNVWDWTLFSSAIVSIMHSSTGRNFKFPYFLNLTETWKCQDQMLTALPLISVRPAET